MSKHELCFDFGQGEVGVRPGHLEGTTDDLCEQTQDLAALLEKIKPILLVMQQEWITDAERA